MYTSYVFVILAIVAVIVVGKTATVVPQQSAYVIEALGK
jgi:regulator of protease activity HflC (stomatin/prohibitin superfamily)